MLQDANRLRLEFNEALDPTTALAIDNYQIEPNVKIASAGLDTQDPKVVILEIDPSSPVGPFWVEYFITVSNVKSQRGAVIKFGQGDSAALVFSSPDLSQVFAYPNPYRGDSAQDFVTIAGLTREATIRILDTSGRLVRTLQEADGNGGVEWDLKDEAGEDVASGIFIFYVIGEGSRGIGKLAVVR